MIVILKHADFSANNIGKIDIPEDYSETVKAMATALGGLTADKLSALNTFYNGLVSAGLYSKLDYLYLPILANGLDKCFVNIANSNSVDWTPNADYYEKNEYGVAPILSSLDSSFSNTSATDATGISASKTVDNTSMFVYSADTYTLDTSVPNNAYIISLHGYNANSRLAVSNFGTSATTFNISAKFGSKTAPCYVSQKTAHTLFTVNMTVGSVTTIYYENNSAQSTEIIDESSSNTIATWMPMRNYSKQPAGRCEISVLGWTKSGSQLTQDEHNTLLSLIVAMENTILA